MELLVTALPSVISAVCVALLLGIAKRVGKLREETRRDWTVLKESQRNQLKSQIVVRYERAVERGSISAHDLESVMRMAESYYALGGNSYIHSLMARLDKMEVSDER